MNKVTLKDIAQKVNTTPNTVSRVLNDKPGISESMRLKIKQAAKELGYIRDEAASSLRSGSSKLIAIVFNNLKNPYYFLMTRYLWEYITIHNYQIVIFQCETDFLSLKELNAIISRRVDGVITFSRPNAECLDIIKKQNINIVLLGREGEDMFITSIYQNDRRGGSLAGEYLYSKGHTNVGYIGVRPDLLIDNKRYQGFKEYYLNQGIDISSNYYLTKSDPNLLEEAIEKFVKNGVTGIFCFNDNLVFDIKHYMIKHHKDKQFECVGFDNIEEGLNMPKTFKTIDSDKQEAANYAVKALFDKIENNSVEHYTKLIDVRLV